jgi:hypothetical protein
MFTNRNRIDDYFSRVINSIDVVCEKKLMDLGVEQKDEQKELNTLRDFFIDKINELKTFNLTQTGERYCFFIPNDSSRAKKRKLSIEDVTDVQQENSDTDDEDSDDGYPLYFKNKLGYLMILNVFLNNKVIDEFK